MKILQQLADDMQLMFRRPARMQSAALCYRLKKKQGILEVLLVTSRDTGRWVIPKGWPMRGKKSHAVAEREAYEEAGVKGKVQHDVLGTYSYQKGVQDGFSVPCKVQVHALEVDSLLDTYPENGTRKLEWVSCEEAASRVNEPELKAILLAFADRILPGRTHRSNSHDAA